MAAAAGGGSRPRTGEDGFLARSGVTSYVRDVLTLVLETRPADPIAFIAEYLGNATKGVPAVTRAFRQLRSLPYNHPQFTESVAAAYATLEGARGGAGSDAKGVMGGEATQLLGMLCSDFSPQASDLLLQRFGRRDTQVVPFAHFLQAVQACDMYASFIARAEGLFHALDRTGTGLVDKRLCEMLLQELARPGDSNWPQALQDGVAGALKPGAPAVSAGVSVAAFVQSASTLFLRALAGPAK